MHIKYIKKQIRNKKHLSAKWTGINLKYHPEHPSSSPVKKQGGQTELKQHIEYA